MRLGLTDGASPHTAPPASRHPRRLTAPARRTTPTRPAPAIPPRSPLSSLRHQDLREGSAVKALLFDDVQLQVLCQLREWAVSRADRNRDRRQLVFVDEAQAGQRLGEVGAAVD